MRQACLLSNIMPNKFDPSPQPEEENFPDRPLECSDCKKPIANQYTEIIGPNVTHTCMCSDCPVLERRLFGLRTQGGGGDYKGEGGTGLACGNCGTTLESLRVGAALGCSSCYDVFEEMIIAELLNIDKMPARLTNIKKSESLHIGRIPGQTQEISSSMRLLALNEALNETIQREDYEQAAKLRDQIKALTDDQKTEQKNDQENGKEKPDGG